MLQQAAPSTQQAPHPLTAHATRTCCRLTAVGPLHAAGSLQAPLLIDLAMVAKQHCAAEGPGRVGARPDEVLLTAVLCGASERRARALGGDRTPHLVLSATWPSCVELLPGWGSFRGSGKALGALRVQK